MRKIALLAFVAMIFVNSANAQSFLSGLFNKLSGSGNTEEIQGTVTNVLGSLLGESMTLKKSTILGTWTYDGTSCVLDSEDALSKIGGSVVTTKIEDKMNGYLKKVGVKEGTCSFTFQENDSCTFRVGSREVNGTYVLDGENKTIQFSFLYGRFTSTAHVAYNINSLNIVFNADKLLNLVQKVTPAVAKYNATMSTLATMLENYKGMKLGMKLKKK